MAVFDVADLSALEILDSRGRPTLAVMVRLADGSTTSARVPSGASTGSREAVERRDGDPARYEGKGVLGAAAAVNTEIAGLLRGRSWSSLAEADQAMIALDDTANKSRLRQTRRSPREPAGVRSPPCAVGATGRLPRQPRHHGHQHVFRPAVAAGADP
jgi:enolase